MSTKKPAELLGRYEELKGIIAQAEEELEELKPEVIALIPEGKEVEGDYGVFVVQDRPTWKYSGKHSLAKKALKELEEEEKAKGIAKKVSNPVLYYNKKKPEEESVD